MADRFFIAPYDQESGVQTNIRPWLIPDTAFSVLENSYVFRGRVIKRFGSTWLNNNPLLSRLRVSVGVTSGLGVLAGFVPRNALNIPIATPAIGQQFSIDTTIFTVQSLGNPTTLAKTGAATIAEFDTTTGAFNFTGVTANTIVFYYPALPVMGLLTFENTPISDERLIAFDTRFAYEYGTGWNRISGENAPGDATWTGSDIDFFWGASWSGVDPAERVFYVTNFNQTEPNFLRYMIGSTWHSFNPQINNGPDYLFSARIIVPFKNRLVALNTWEGPDLLTQRNFGMRARYSKANASPFAANSWNQDIKGNGNAIDAATMESIVSVEFIKDRLIVFFERSTWELAYTGNQVQPFVWQKINTELGAESTFSVIPFDQVILGIGNVGIHACNGGNVERIDTKIPQEVFVINNVNSGPERVYGIRDYGPEMVYWSFPNTKSTADQPFPNQVLVYNYRTGTWAINDDSITAFGYYQPSEGINWSSELITWDSEITWDEATVSERARQVIAGNQEGFTFVVDFEVHTNASVLQITNAIVSGNNVLLTVIDHNLRANDFIYIERCVWDTGNDLNDQIFKIELIPPTKDTILISVNNYAGNIYFGGGLISRVSQVNITTKQYNFYATKGRNAYVSKVDFLVDKTDAAAYQVNYAVSTSSVPLSQQSINNGTIMGSGTLDTFPYALYPYEESSDRLWHPVYFQADGEVIQFQIIMNDGQMKDTDMRKDDFQLHAMCIHAIPTSQRLQ